MKTDSELTASATVSNTGELYVPYLPVPQITDNSQTADCDDTTIDLKELVGDKE